MALTTGERGRSPYTDLHVKPYAKRHVKVYADNHAHRVIVRIDRAWPWAANLVAAFTRLRALPATARGLQW
jgi:hypothetical protein